MKKTSVKKNTLKKVGNKKKQLWVIKIGSQLIVEKGPLLIRALIAEVAALKNKNVEIVWVTSGAIATARQQIHHGWKTLPEKQALSAVGQPALMELYNTALQFHGLRGGQVLLSYADFKGKTSRTNLTNTLHQLLEWDCIPVLNENDAVATDEIQFGDNDMLSALVATEINADQLIILTNVEGLYDRDPAIPGAQLISELAKVPDSLLKKLKTASLSSSGRGGIYSKLKAARYAQKKGVSTVIIRGDRFNVLNDLAEGQKIGTRVLV